MDLEPDFERLESTDLDEEEFTNIYANLIQTSVPGALANVVALLRINAELPSQSDEMLQAQIGLEKIWEACKDKPGRRLLFIEPQISMLRDSTKLTRLAFESVENSLIPIIRNNVQISEIEKKIDQQLVKERLGSDLFVIYGVKSDVAIGYLSTDGRSALSLTDAELREKSVENLKAILYGEISLKGGPELWVLASGREFESSLLLHKKFMNNMRDMVKGSLIVAVPARDIVVICGEESPDELEKMKLFVQQQFEAAEHPVSPNLYFYTEAELISIG